MIELSSMFPVLVASDLDALKDFYQQHFGFQAVFFDASFYLHLLHEDSGAQLGFMVPDHPSQPDFLHTLASTQGMVISLDVQQAEIAFQAAVQSGLDVVFDYKVEDFGLTHIMVKDPAGFIVDIVEHHEQ